MHALKHLRVLLLAAFIAPIGLESFDELGIGAPRSLAQGSIGPDWTNIMAAPRLPDYGYKHVNYDPSDPNNTGRDFELQASIGGDQAREDSAEEWWYSHCNIKDGNGEVVAYAAVGYAAALSWRPYDSTGCHPWGPIVGPPQRDEFETDNLRRVLTLRAYAALFLLDGTMVWCRTFLPGTFYGVSQASDGTIVAVGDVTLPRRAEIPVNDDDPLLYNPGLGSGYDIADVRCDQPIGIGQPALGPMQSKGYIVKIDLNGELVWQNAYSNAVDYENGWGQGARCYGIAPISVQGEPCFYVTMETQAASNMWGMRIRQSDGHVVDRAVLPLITGSSIRAVNVASAVHNGTTHLAFGGTHYTSSVPGAPTYSAFAAHIGDMDAAPYTFTETWSTIQSALSPWHATERLQNSSDIAFAVDQGQLNLIWPVLSDFSPGTDIAQGRSIAQLRVHRLQPSSPVPVWTSDLGEMRAYDLQAGVVQTTDGNIAVVSSRWPPEYNEDHPFGYDDLSPEVTTCLTQQFGDIDWANSLQYDYWNTDTYVAKIRLEDGVPLWWTSFDAEPDPAPSCYPADVRDQECMYRITEAHDGGLVLCGNTSHNFDDAYLAKVSAPCQAFQSYALLPLNGNGEHILASNTNWTTNMDIYGTIVIPDGRSLSITDCTIRFADSEQLALPSRIIVEPGGQLIVNNAILTSIANCPNSLWDGVQVNGNYFERQLPQNQGFVSLKNSTISNARTAIMLAAGDLADPTAGIIKESTGGILEATGSTFLNNRYDAVFHPFENRLSNGTVINNVSYLSNCTFITNGGVPAQGQFPETHVYMHGVRGIPLKGCSWMNTLVAQELEWPSQQGTGIQSINSSFSVSDYCSSLVAYPNPCPPANTTTSSFTNLHRGILATTFKPDRTFSVDNATFTGTNFGIRMEGIQDASITRCSFDVPTPFTPGIVGATYGVYSDECTGYRIQENSFFTNQPGSPRKVGLIIKDSGTNYNTFYNNTFDNLYTGSIIQGQNAGTDDALGLEVKCNDYGLADANSFDVALTAWPVRVQKTQGQPLNPIDPSTFVNPAGNRFSVDHEANPGSYDAESDWHVQATATVVEYFHHSPSPGSRTKPQYSDAPFEIIPTDEVALWPSKPIACPSMLDNGGKEVKRLMAEGEHEEYENSKDAYDATKDNGDTYTLLGYVSDPSKSSTQVRNALQSVAPKVSAEVWRTAFERSPAMSAWHITQALLSNSPLQSEVLLMVDDYGLPTGYASMVHAAQTGVNVLTLLESSMAKHGGNKAEALHDLGRMTWLDSLNLDQALDSLLLLHTLLPSDNHALAASGVHLAKGDYSALLALAMAEESASEHPQRYTLLKHLAQLEQAGNWAEPDEALRNWLSNLGQQRDVLGSAWANAWLHALGEELPEEVIVLPEAGPKSAGRARQLQPVQWPAEEMLEVFPNPARNLAYVAFDLGGSEQAQLRVLDLHGRQISSQVLSGAEGIATIPLDGLSNGLYLIEVVRRDAPNQQARLVVQ
jgi:hypothetical protein